MECEVEEVRCMRSGIHGETLSDYMIKSYDKRTGLTDVTIHCNESIYHAHRIVLSHYSGFFKSVFESLVGVVNHFDVFLEGFSVREVEVSLLFMYTGGVVCYNGENPNSFNSVAHALHIPLLADFLYAQQYAQCEETDKLTSPVGVWEKCDSSAVPIDIIDTANSTSSRDDSNHADKHDTASGSVRRKQARPQRHTASPSPGGSPEPEIIDEDEDVSIDGCSEDEEREELECHESVRSASPDVSQENKVVVGGVIPPPPPPPNFLFLRNMINNPGTGGNFYSPPHFCAPPHLPLPQIQQKKIKDKVLWGKILKHQAFHATSRAQHSAPRGGPPRAWSNQDLTEALHNVWNKKMTTSQASRIFGIPYNSLLMYVRGKYGKSLKLDLLKKGLDLALLEKQKQAAMEQARNVKTTGVYHHHHHKDHSDERIPTTQQNNNVVEWMMMNNSNMTCPSKPDTTVFRNPHSSNQ